MGMTDVVQMAQQGQSEDVIINQIRATHSCFQLSANDLNFLKQSGVPDRVIIEMQNARPQATVVGSPRPVYVNPPTTVVYEPAPMLIYGRPHYYRRYW